MLKIVKYCKKQHFGKVWDEVDFFYADKYNILHWFIYVLIVLMANVFATFLQLHKHDQKCNICMLHRFYTKQNLRRWPLFAQYFLEPITFDTLQFKTFDN